MNSNYIRNSMVGCLGVISSILSNCAEKPKSESEKLVDLLGQTTTTQNIGVHGLNDTPLEKAGFIIPQFSSAGCAPCLVMEDAILSYLKDSNSMYGDTAWFHVKGLGITSSQSDYFVDRYFSERDFDSQGYPVVEIWERDKDEWRQVKLDWGESGKRTPFRFLRNVEHVVLDEPFPAELSPSINKFQAAYSTQDQGNAHYMIFGLGLANVTDKLDVEFQKGNGLVFTGDLDEMIDFFFWSSRSSSKMPGRNAFTSRGEAPELWGVPLNREASSFREIPESIEDIIRDRFGDEILGFSGRVYPTLIGALSNYYFPIQDLKLEERREWMAERLELLEWMNRESALRIGKRSSVGQDIASKIINNRREIFDGKKNVYYFPQSLSEHTRELLRDYAEREDIGVVWVPSYDPKFLPRDVPEGERRELLKRSKLWDKLCEQADGNVHILSDNTPKGVLEEIIGSEGKTVVFCADYELDFSTENVRSLAKGHTALYLFVNKAREMKKVDNDVRFVTVPRISRSWTGFPLHSLSNWIAAGALDEMWATFENGELIMMGEVASKEGIRFVGPQGDLE